LSAANLSRSLLRFADLQNANLSHAVLFGVDLTGADLSGADLSGADLSASKLEAAKFCPCQLGGYGVFRACRQIRVKKSGFQQKQRSGDF